MNNNYGEIRTTNDLRKLQEQANLTNEIAVGIAHNRKMYKLENDVAKEIKKEEAIEILGLTEEQFFEVLATRGHKKFNDPKPEIVEVKEEPKQDEQVEEVKVVEQVEPKVEEPKEEDKHVCTCQHFEKAFNPDNQLMVILENKLEEIKNLLIDKSLETNESTKELILAVKEEIKDLKELLNQNINLNKAVLKELLVDVDNLESK